MGIRDISSALDDLAKDIEKVKAEAEQGHNCRATLYVNFVSRKTCGIQFEAEQVDKWSTHQFLLEVLMALKQKIDT